MGKTYFSLAAIHKQESPFLKEWIDYHLLVGVEHFYLGCNDDNDSEVLSILKPYIERNVVTHIHIPGICKQLEFYKMIVQTVSSKWVGFIDADEFILPINTQTVSELLSKYEQFGGLSICWRVYGSKFDMNPKSQINELLYRLTDSLTEKHPYATIKTIVQPSLVIGISNPHNFSYRDGYFSINEKFNRVDDMFCRPITCDDITLNHYWLRSKDWYFNVKRKRGRSDIGPGDFYDEYLFDYVNDNATVFDDLISRKYGEKSF